jgi:hypothetical protein
MMIDHLRLKRASGSSLSLDDIEASGDVQIGATIELISPALGGVIRATVDRVNDQTTVSRGGTSHDPIDATGPLTVWATEI